MRFFIIFFCGFKKVPIFASRKDARTGSTSAIDASIIALGLHRPCGEILNSFIERDNKQYLQASIHNYFNSFPETSQIMIRFFDDSILQLDGICIQKDQTREGGWLVKYDVFHSTAESEIKKEDIERLKIGIQKIRVTTVPNILERTYKKDKAESKLYELYKKSAF